MLFVLLAMLPVRAQDDSAYFENLAAGIESAMDAGRLGEALKAADGDILGDLSAAPAGLRRVAAVAARRARADAAKEPGVWEDLVTRLEACCKGVAGEAEGSEDVAAAEALILACGARVALVLHEKEGAGKWAQAADRFLALDKKHPGDGEYLAQAAQILREGGEAGLEDSADLARRADKLLLTGLRRYPRKDAFLEAAHRDRLRKIRTLIPKQRAAAKKLAQAYAKDLADRRKRAGDQAALLDSMYNDLVSLSLEEKKLGLRLVYRTHVLTLMGKLQCDVPISKRWKKDGGTIVQRDDLGNELRVWDLKSYDWDTNYYLEEQEFGGANVKGLARIGENLALQEIVDVKWRKPLGKKRLSKGVRKAQTFVIAGLDKTGRDICVRAFYYKSRKYKGHSYRLWIRENGAHKKLDVEAAFVLASARE